MIQSHNMEGTIVKSIAGFYYVNTGEDLWECKARGIFKKQGKIPLVGDMVDISLTGGGKGVIETIKPRINSFIRPPVANVEVFVILLACTDPAPNLPLTDRFLVMAEHSGTDIVLGINKCDLDREGIAGHIADIYSDIYPVVRLSASEHEGLKELSDAIAGKKAAFAGPSGVGKSSVINLLHPGAGAQTGDISRKTKRGKHTTRHVEMFKYEGGYVFDTPGFSSFDILEADRDSLDRCFPEMIPYMDSCRFDDCKHMEEPDCAVKEAVEKGIIKESRYESYRELMTELIERTDYR